jgi:signal transduction histidine kinase
MPWSDGPAAYVVAKRYDPRIGWGAFDDSWALALLVFALVGAVLVSMGPIVKRVRLLEESVRRSAASRYSKPVPIQGTDEIAELAQAFNTAGADVRAQIDVIEKRERSLRDFVENTTHDVMLPLTVLQGHLSRMRNELAGGVTPSREVVREALEESHYLASLVQNLGAAAKLEAGEPSLRHDPFAWNALIDRVVLRHKSIAKEKGVELDFAVPEEDVISEGDVTLVEQAVSNVLHNAVRYNKAGGHVAILLEARDGRFSVRVFDDGPGVSAVEMARLSERSYRSDAARARYPDGRGLGLSIAKDVAERHGFELTLKRSDAGGLEVVFRGACAATKVATTS